jgi:ferredoxin-NADP reductase
MSRSLDIRTRVDRITTVAEGIKRFDLVPEQGGPLPCFAAGAHVILSMTDGTRTWRNPYSLMGSQGDRSRYSISVLRTAHSRGGSHFLHDRVSVGTRISITPPINLFPLELSGRHHLLIAGGIGITPIMSMAEQLNRLGASFDLHYGVRDPARAAYARQMVDRFGERVRLYYDSAGAKLPLDTLLDQQPLGTHLYVCGPGPMIDWVLDRAEAAGWAAENLHSERFTAPAGGQPFTVRLARSGRSLRVGEQETILEAIEAAGLEAPHLCRGGACGHCETEVLSASGPLLHQDHFLTTEQHRAGRRIMICVSRCEGAELVLEL